jgi:hypothetical protein
MEERKHRVYPATPYEYGQLGSLGNAAYMLLRQFQFPDTFSGKDKLASADHDRCMQWDHNHASRCFKEHTGTGELGLEGWLQRATDEQVIQFLVDILKAESNVVWTGYRIMGSVHRGNGYPVWSLSLFAKHPESDTVVYTGANAPNVQPKRRY